MTNRVLSRKTIGEQARPQRLKRPATTSLGGRRTIAGREDHYGPGQKVGHLAGIDSYGQARQKRTQWKDWVCNAAKGTKSRIRGTLRTT